MSVKTHIGLLSLLLALAACTLSCRRPVKVSQQAKPVNVKEPLVRVNEQLLKKDADLISQYTKDKGWDMQVSSTGLWYMIYEKGHGPRPQHGTPVSLAYTLSLLDGTLCYTSDSLGLKEFALGTSPIERGLQEGVSLMQQGDKARLILLPHMGFGLLGDQHKIPPRATVVYDISLVHVKQ